MRRIAFAAVSIAAVLGLGTTEISAHSVLQQSFPPANVSLSAPPPVVLLVFTEPVVPGLSTATVIDRAGSIVTRSSMVTNEDRALSVVTSMLTPGVYTVRWRVLSAIDGHTTSGFLLFGIRTPLPAEAPLSVAASAPPVAQVLIRWLNFSAAILLAGTALFQFLILRPAFPPGPMENATVLPTQAGGRLRLIEVSAAAALLGGLFAEFVLEAALLFDTSVIGVWRTGTLGALIGGTKAGWSILTRALGALMFLIPRSPSGRIFRVSLLVWCVIVSGTAALLGGFLALAASDHLAMLVLVATVYGLVSVMAAVLVPQIPDVSVPEWPVVPLIAAGLVLAGMTVSSHALGRGPTAVALDWIHLVASSLWIGGLLPLWVVLRAVPPSDRSLITPVLVSRFSQAAAIALAVVGVTGIYSALVHIPTLGALVSSSYGLTLLAKVVLVLPAAMVGAYNRLVLRPYVKGQAREDDSQRRFLRSVSAEITLGAAILLVVALLTITPPPSVTTQARGGPTRPGPPLLLVGQAGLFRVALAMSPAEPGWNRFEATVRTGEKSVDPTQTSVFLRLTKLDEQLDATMVTMKPGTDRFVADNTSLGPGWWEVRLVVRQRGKADAATTFPVRLGAQTRGPSDPEAVHLLKEVRGAAGRVRTWREIEQITDGSGGVSVTNFQWMIPDRVHYRTASGSEAVIVGATRYFRQGQGPWERDALPTPIAVQGPYLVYLQDPSAISLGRRGTCDSEPCRIVMWQAASGSVNFAAWVGLRSFRTYDLFMVAPYHLMTSEARDFNSPLRILPP